jgi:hypothetical protein
MPNIYYNETFTSIAGNLARARMLETQFAGIEDGFDRIRDDLDVIETDITALQNAAFHDPLDVAGTANQINVSTNTAGARDVATASLSSTLQFPGTAAYSTGEPVGFMNIEQEAISEAYTTVLGDANRSKVHPASDTTARAWVLGNLAYRMGAAITFINEVGAGEITLTATGGNFLLLGTGTVTSITIAAGGGCTVIRIPGTNRWSVSGAGITGTA